MMSASVENIRSLDGRLRRMIRDQIVKATAMGIQSGIGEKAALALVGAAALAEACNTLDVAVGPERLVEVLEGAIGEARKRSAPRGVAS
jgi:hypothetical protein